MTTNTTNRANNRFRNTLRDLQDCYEAMDDMDISPVEQTAHDQLIELCQQIATEFGFSSEQQSDISSASVDMFFSKLREGVARGLEKVQTPDRRNTSGAFSKGSDD